MFTLEIIKAIVLGIVEGLTEWLPVSSTGHMILVDEFMSLNVSKAFMDMFLVVIQLGAILAVVALNFDRLNPFSKRKTYLKKRQTISLWGKVIVGCIPAAVIGLAFNDYMEEHFMNAQVVAFTLILYGVLFIIVKKYNKHITKNRKDIDYLDYKTALIIGFFQVLSLVPGTSRSGSTEYTFFLAIPVMFGASALKLFKFGFNYTFEEVILLLVGMVVAFIVSIISIKFLLRYVRTNDFKAFGWYRIILGLIVFVYFYFQG